MPAPFSVIEPVANAFCIQDAGQAHRFMAGVIPLSRPQNDSHMIEFPRIGDVREVFIRAVEVNVVIVIAVKIIPDFEGAAQADESLPHRGI